MKSYKSYPHLVNAPIIEAVVDIQVKLPSHISVEDLHQSYRFVNDKFPNKKEIFEISAELKIEKGQPQPIVNKSKPTGYFYKSTDNSKLIQYRLNGFSYNKLKPYTSWNDIYNEAKIYWELYRNQFNPEHITRIAVRYINYLNLPLPISDYGIYLKTPPVILEGFPRQLNGFITKLVLYDPVKKYTTHITQQLDKITAKYAVILFDIDIFLKQQFSSNDDKIWYLLNTFHTVKNDIFFNSITNETLELFK